MPYCITALLNKLQRHHIHDAIEHLLDEARAAYAAGDWQRAGALAQLATAHLAYIR